MARKNNTYKVHKETTIAITVRLPAFWSSLPHAPIIAKGHQSVKLEVSINFCVTDESLFADSKLDDNLDNYKKVKVIYILMLPEVQDFPPS